MLDIAHARHTMVERQLARRGLADPRVREAMLAVPREAFVPEALQEFAYDDTALPIEHGQTISQPYVVAAMFEAAAVQPADRVLEIGAGSGYAAAVLGQLAAHVTALERHPELARAAQDRIARLGYATVEILAADGADGWEPGAPYDVIIGAAGAHSIPEAWKAQLAPGGRLVVPVGDSPRRQRLVKLTRSPGGRFESQELAEVAFVPLVGAHGWLPEFGRLFDRWGGCKVVLLGEASHGTSEFYRARAAITRRLIEAHGFTIVAVEADWPDAAAVDRYVRDRPARAEAEPPFQRFPTWMWRNVEVEAFLTWLRAHNQSRPTDARAGFFGLDMYNLSGSITAVLAYLDQVDPEAAAVARERYGCLTRWQKDPAAYGRMALSGGYSDCEQAVVAQLKALLSKRLDYAAGDGPEFLDAAQNARLVTAAERYYRVMYYGGAEGWNLRDTHMFETLEHLLEAHGEDAKAVVWAHNSHIGDARFTEMGVVRDELNLGQLCRQRFGEDAALIGFGTHAGEVAAASDWDAPMQVKRVRPSRSDSYERVCHDAGVGRFLLDLGEAAHPELRRRLLEPRRERFIGVIYRPETELQSHYAEASLPQQFNAFVWFDETTAVTPLPATFKSGAEETFPFGL